MLAHVALAYVRTLYHGVSRGFVGGGLFDRSFFLQVPLGLC